jgi:hypothetical protein
MLKKKKKELIVKEKNEEREQQIAVIIIVYVCVMQSTSIGKNDTLNCIEKTFFCCSEPTV